MEIIKRRISTKTKGNLDMKLVDIWQTFFEIIFHNSLVRYTTYFMQQLTPETREKVLKEMGLWGHEQKSFKASKSPNPY